MEDTNVIEIRPQWSTVQPPMINSIVALDETMAWCWSDHKPLSEPMMAKLNDIFMRHSVSMT